MSKTVSPLRDRELVELLADDPELLAIADALVATQGHSTLGSPRLNRRRWSRAAAIAAVGVAAISLALIAPWKSNGLVDRALAAVGQGPVLHVVTEQPSPFGWYKPVSLATGKTVATTERQEIWFDQGLDLKKTVTTLNGAAYDDMLETAQGGFTTRGPIYTCSWIAAHPAEAASSGVSCNFDGSGNAEHAGVADQSPTLDLALAGFVDHYRSALASGQASEMGRDTLEGQPVIWLRITSSDPSALYPSTEDVAIDASSYKPVLVRTAGANAVEFRVVSIDTEPYHASVFSKPVQGDAPASGHVSQTSPIAFADAASQLNGKTLWLGQTWKGYTLAGVEEQQLVTGYGSASARSPEHSTGLVLTYASSTDPAGGNELEIREATECEIAWGMPCGGGITLASGTLLSGLPFSSSVTVINGVYVSISQPPGGADPVTVANSLQRMG